MVYNISHNEDELSVEKKMKMQIICGLIMRTNSTPISNNFLGSIKICTTNLTHDAQILI